ncbi:M1 family metallopeptidase [Rhizosphaericola mali]|uniref:M1 family peptidase n=1 Tax=Rhizosphaericola mali TaxID=2545455 RepID=A0A5P2FZU5_9BACT|nr:M1 family metallopeptidase [Rhizosphaericola mali]QES88487.1 M1 family peptidase [Rhizosphaericola mali]
MKRLLFSTFLLTTISAAHAQYNPHEAFDPNFYTSNGNEYRSASGLPGPKYWQNKADYKVVASFDTSSMLLKGNVEIDYKNNSGDSLKYLWLELDQNNDKENERGRLMQNPTAKVDEKKGFQLASVQVLVDGKWEKVDYILNDTRMQIKLKHKFAGNSSIKIAIDYSYTLLENGGGDRSGYLDTKNGRIYEFSYWYPRMAVYDDLIGWNTLPFVGGGEMYMDYGNIDYTLTVPSNLMLVGSGELVNEKEVFTSTILGKLNQARNSENTVVIRSKEDLNKSFTQTKNGTTTWHLKMENTRDVAWAMSKAYIWDAAKIDLPENKTALAQSVYPGESIAGDSGWTNATQYLKGSVEIFSKHWFPFPYSVATNVGGPVGGMEFPALAFDHWKASGKDLWMLVSHEIGHSWYPMIVGSNERKNAWMDEGFNTFVDIYAQDEYKNGRFAPKRDGEYAAKGGNPADEIIPVIADRKNGAFIITAPDATDYKDVHPLAYFKTAFGLVLLREVILGQERFDYAFSNYTHDWAFKHPAPEDFFRSMENGAGEDLSWFWRGWFYKNWQVDQAVTKVVQTKKDGRYGADITIENKEKLPLPVPVEIKDKSGKVKTFQLPVEIWQRGGTWTFHVDTDAALSQVILDPKHQLPDIDRSNNEWNG